MRVLVVGATGLLGKALLEEWSGDEVHGISSRDADICERSALRGQFVRLRPDWTVLTAAYTNVDACEANQEQARKVNVTGAGNVALQCKEIGSRLLFLSTDYVFDGTKSTPYQPDDKTNPLSVYGQSKADGEHLVREILPDACIVRTSWIFGANGRCFPNTILECAKAGKQLSVVDDQVGRPTYNRDLARAISRLCKAGAQGTVHASNSGSCSWHEFACHLLPAAGFGDLEVKAIKTEELSRPAMRPKHSVLSLTSLERYGIVMQNWQDAVADYVKEWNALQRMQGLPQPKSAGTT